MLHEIKVPNVEAARLELQERRNLYPDFIHKARSEGNWLVIRSVPIGVYIDGVASRMLDNAYTNNPYTNTPYARYKDSRR